MKPLCQAVIGVLAEQGPAGLKGQAELKEHLIECNTCFAYMEAGESLEEGFEELPEYDAPEEVVNGLLAKISLEPLRPAVAPVPKIARWVEWARGSARLGIGKFKDAWQGRYRWIVRPLTAVLLIVFGYEWLFEHSYSTSPLNYNEYRVETVVEIIFGYLEGTFGALLMLSAAAAAFLTVLLRRFKMAGAFATAAVGAFLLRGVTSTFFNTESIDSMDGPGWPALSSSAPQVIYNDERIGGQAFGGARQETEGGKQFADALSLRKPSEAYAAKEKDRRRGQDQAASMDAKVAGLENQLAEVKQKNSEYEERTAEIFKRVLERMAENESTVIDSSAAAVAPAKKFEGADKSDAGAYSYEGDEVSNLRPEGQIARQNVPAPLQGKIRSDVDKGSFRGLAPHDHDDPPGRPSPVAPRAMVPQPPNGALEAFLFNRQNTTGLTYREPRGYWSNTYVPGDPDFLRLAFDLKAGGRQVLERYTNAALHDFAKRPVQPFDRPENAALAVYLRADRRTAGQHGEKTRLLLQVGLQATERHSGSRPAMNIGLVLDAEGLNSGSEAAVAALIESFARAKEGGDRFSLTVAGKAGGTVIRPEDFRYGTVSVALKNIFSKERDKTGLSLPAAFAAAKELAGSADNPQSALGSSMLVLITTRRLGNSADALQGIAHQSAVDGLPVSVVGVGAAVDNGEVTNIALAGQGSRRFLSSVADAAGLVEKELTALSRVVARAVRLRIRLGANVKLVDVPGSYRLDQVAAERVRQAEQSVDQRLSRNLGIQADRGEDEEGIQIVIPVFYAGDAHVILLDTVVEGAGNLADVSARFKDLVFLNNGVSRANLSLEAGSSSPGPLELNVLKNLVSFNFYQMLEAAGNDVSQGYGEMAAGRVTYLQNLIGGLMQRYRGLQGDPDLQNAAALLAQYQALLHAGAAHDDAARKYTSESLKYSGKLQVLPRPQLE